MRHCSVCWLIVLAALLLLLGPSVAAEAKGKPGPGKCHPQCTKYGQVDL